MEIERKNVIKNIVFFSLLLVIFFVFYFVSPQTALNGKKDYGQVIFHGPKTEKLVALTFDDGPSPIFTRQILAILKEHNVKATFFLVGANVLKHPDIVKEIIEQGHGIANHSFDHPNMILRTPHTLLTQLNYTREAIFKATGVTVHDFRPPFGRKDMLLLDILKGEEYDVIMWSLNSNDWKKKTTDRKIYKLVTEKVKPGDIILLHDNFHNRKKPNCQPTVKALPNIIKNLKERGYTFVTIEQMKAKIK